MAWAPLEGGGGWVPDPPAVPPPVAGSPGTPGVPGHPAQVNIAGRHPDYNALISGDPGLMAWLAAKPGRESALGATRAADVRSLVKRFGGVPKGFQDQYGDITPEDLAAAQ